MYRQIRLLSISFILIVMVGMVVSCSKKVQPVTGLVRGGVEAVDLGLSVKWGSCNIGAKSSSDLGQYFAWGETQAKAEYTWDNYKHYKRGEGAEKGMKGEKTKKGITKYCSDRHGYEGLRDRKMTLDAEDDVAHEALGEGWRMPTVDELNELKERYRWEWQTTDAKVSGYRVTGPNGNSIFLPVTGISQGKAVNQQKGDGCYWTSSLHTGSSYGVYSLNFDSECVEIYYGRRDCGRAVRPVMDGGKAVKEYKGGE